MRVAVVGGGIAGLTAAFDLAGEGAEVVLYESGPRVGGKVVTGHVGDFDLDLGAESMLARRPEALALVADVGLGDRVVRPVPTPAMIWTRGGLHPMPPTVMGIPGDPDSLVTAGIAEHPVTSVPLAVPDEDVPVAQFVAERVGQDVVERLIEPLLGGVYAGHADRLSLRAAAPILATLGPDLMAGAAERLAVPRDGGMLAGLVGGMGVLSTALAESGTFDVRLDSTVRSLVREAAGWTVVVGPTTAIVRETFDAVVVAVPAPAASRLLAEVAAEASFALAGIDYASMAVVTLVLEGADLPPGSGFLVPPVDRTAIKAATFSSSKWEWLAERAGDASIVRASLGRAGETAVLQRPDDQIVDDAVADLRRAIEPLGSLGTVTASHVQRWGGGLPQYEVGHLDLVETVERSVSTVPGLEICGAAYHGVGIAAVVATARAAAARTRAG